LPLASRQWVVGETLLVSVAPLVPLMDPDEPDDCAEAERAPHAISADASNVVFRTFICVSPWGISTAQSLLRQSVPGTSKFKKRLPEEEPLARGSNFKHIRSSLNVAWNGGNLCRLCPRVC
jgi:hypothetical protein